MYNNEFEKDTPWDDLHEECGVFGMYDFDGGDVASTIYYGLFALQHRGQESCGIAVSETDGPKGKVTSHKGMGLVNEVFAQDNLEPMKGDIGVGHVRYSTAGASTRENAQPLVLNYVKVRWRWHITVISSMQWSFAKIWNIPEQFSRRPLTPR